MYEEQKEKQKQKNICEILQPNEVNYYNAKVWMTRAQQNKTKQNEHQQHNTERKKNAI